MVLSSPHGKGCWHRLSLRVPQAMESVYEMERKNMTDSINPYNAVLMGLARLAPTAKPKSMVGHTPD
eukprot:2120240-Amphidinium_carterae.2